MPNLCAHDGIDIGIQLAWACGIGDNFGARVLPIVVLARLSRSCYSNASVVRGPIVTRNQ